jgi:uroporphyrinogen decarboxylase
MMPIDQMGVDAAIIFSDILVVPQAMGIHVEMNEGTGPQIPTPIRSLEAVVNLVMPDVHDRLSYVFEALKLTKKTLAGRVPLIGFAGSPWTILCYVVEGKGSKTFDIAKKFLFQEPQAAHLLLDKITDVTIEYLKAQHKAGADVVYCRKMILKFGLCHIYNGLLRL